MNQQPEPTPQDPGDLPVGQVLVGDVREQLRGLPPGSVDCLVSSPPYFRLRNYQHANQLGLEATVRQWVTNLADVLDDLTRVLTPLATVWLNVGDSYSRHASSGAPPKSLVLAPEHLVVELVRRGWIARNKVVWAKTNPMPTSVRDRLACTWEPIYLLTRSGRYHFDLDAIRVPHRTARTRRTKRPKRAPRVVPEWQGPLAGKNDGLDRMKADGRPGHARGKNPGDVWSIATSSYRGAHFATFPEQLVERPILAGCPPKICTNCGAPWRQAAGRIVGHLAVTGELEAACGCGAPWRRGVVLDPFIGSGTTAVVAERLGRDWIGIDLNADFAELARSRIVSSRKRRNKPEQAETDEVQAA
ncbi:MAG: DNA-methyltransferase [Microthrixaceae bacterium]